MSSALAEASCCIYKIIAKEFVALEIVFVRKYVQQDLRCNYLEKPKMTPPQEARSLPRFTSIFSP